MTTKAEMMRWIEAGKAREAFSHATLGSFDITVLRHALRVLRAQGKLVTHHCTFAEMKMVDGMEVDAYEYLIANREVCRERVEALTSRQLEDRLIFLDCPPGTNGTGASQLLVDGIHRMVARKERGYPDFYFYLIPLHIAPRVDQSQFLDVPWGDYSLQPGLGLVRRHK